MKEKTRCLILDGAYCMLYCASNEGKLTLGLGLVLDLDPRGGDNGPISSDMLRLSSPKHNTVVLISLLYFAFSYSLTLVMN